MSPEPFKIGEVNNYFSQNDANSIFRADATDNLTEDQKEKKRVEKEKIEEVIIATSATVEGQTTAYYIKDCLKDLDVKISKLGQGLPIGGEIENSDDGTLYTAFKNRSELGTDSD